MPHLLIEMNQPTEDWVGMFGVPTHSEFPLILEVHDISANQLHTGNSIIQLLDNQIQVFIQRGRSSWEIECELDHEVDWSESVIQTVANTAFHFPGTVITCCELPDPCVEGGRHIQPIIARIRKEDYNEVEEWFERRSNFGVEDWD